MGVQCQIIDYENEYRRYGHDMLGHARQAFRERDFPGTLKYGFGSLATRKRKKKFAEFYGRHLRLTGSRFTSSKDAESLNGQFDRFIVGSDQVWNYQNNGTDFAYLLEFVNDDSRKASYSSSFGLVDIPDNLKARYAELLGKIRSLSTREEHGVKIIKELTGREAELVLDPVFLLDKKRWLSLCPDTNDEEDYVFCYTNRPGQWSEFLNQANRSISGRVHKLTRHIELRDIVDPGVRLKYSISPTEFISAIAHAELVVTASFHCIAMAIILGTPFIAVLTGDRGLDERVLNMLRIAGLEDRLLRNMDRNACCGEIDFDSVDSRIDEYRKRSIDFLKGAIFN